MEKVLGVKSSFRVKWRTAGKVQFLYFRRFLLVLARSSLWGWGWARTIIQQGFEVSLMFPNFL